MPSVLRQRRYSELVFRRQVQEALDPISIKGNLDALTTDYHNWNHRLLPMIMVFAARGQSEQRDLADPEGLGRRGRNAGRVVPPTGPGAIRTNTWASRAARRHAPWTQDRSSTTPTACAGRWTSAVRTTRRSRWPSKRWAETSGPTPRRRCAGEVSRLNNFFNTLTVNDAKHRVEGFATLEQTINTATEQGRHVRPSRPCSKIRWPRRCALVKIVNDRDLKVIDAIRTRTDRSAKIRWTMVSQPPRPEERPDHADEQRQDHVPDRCGGGRDANRPQNIQHRSVHSYDDPNPGIYLVGFEATDARGQMGDLHHDALTRKLIPAAEKPFSPSGPGRRRRLFGVPGVRNPPKTPPSPRSGPHKTTVPEYRE